MGAGPCRGVAETEITVSASTKDAFSVVSDHRWMFDVESEFLNVKMEKKRHGGTVVPVRVIAKRNWCVKVREAITETNEPATYGGGQSGDGSFSYEIVSLGGYGGVCMLGACMPCGSGGGEVTVQQAEFERSSTEIHWTSRVNVGLPLCCIQPCATCARRRQMDRLLLRAKRKLENRGGSGAPTKKDMARKKFYFGMNDQGAA